MNYKSFYASRFFKTAASVIVLAAISATVILALDIRRSPETASVITEKGDYTAVNHNIKKPVCLDLDEKGNFLIGSGSLVYVLAADGSELASIDTGQTVKAVCSGPGFIYTAAGSSLYKISKEANHEITVIADLGNESIVTDLEFKNEMLGAADAGSGILYQFSSLGVLKKIYSFEKEPSLYLPSPWFDSAVLPDGRFWITNTGKHQIDFYSAAGEYIKSCGSSENKSIFEGCCNPVKLEIIDAGRLITWEKGIKRLRVLDYSGNILRELYAKDIFRPDEELIDMTYENGSLYILVHDSIYFMDGL